MSKHLSNHQRKLKIHKVLVEVMLQSNITLQFQCFKNRFDILSVTFVNELRSGQCNKSDLLSYQNHFSEQILCKKRKFPENEVSSFQYYKIGFFSRFYKPERSQKKFWSSGNSKEISKDSHNITFYFSKSFTNNICFWSPL